MNTRNGQKAVEFCGSTVCNNLVHDVKLAHSVCFNIQAALELAVNNCFSFSILSSLFFVGVSYIFTNTLPLDFKFCTYLEKQPSLVSGLLRMINLNWNDMNEMTCNPNHVMQK